MPPPRLVRRRAHLLLHRACHLRDAPKTRFNLARQSIRAHAEAREQRWNDAVLLRDERAEYMQRLDLLMIVARGNVLRRLHGFLGFQCEFIEADHLFLPRIQKTLGPAYRTAAILS